jgi:hypothetical protein
MIELDAREFFHAITELRAVQLLTNAIDEKSLTITTSDTLIVRSHVARLMAAVENLGARSAIKSALRLQQAIEDEEHGVTYLMLLTVLADVESRFADHLDDIQIFVLDEAEARAFGGNSIVDPAISFKFPSTIFEFDEAAKCIALGRHTASVFHLMRVLEIGLRALARYLGIEDPIKPAGKNWAVMLKSIKEKADEQWPPSKSAKVSQRITFDNIYANLDAVRNPWRNSTMHVETIYTPHEASHIFNCTHFFMQKLASLCDEEGSEFC